MRPFPRYLSFLLALVVLVASCSSATEAEPQDREFTLTRFEGVQVPAVWEVVPEVKVEVSSGDFHLSGDGSCGGSISVRITANEKVSDADSETTCTWTQSGNDLTLSWTHVNTGPSSGTLVGSRLTLVHPTGAICVTTPCPTHWTAEYQEWPAV
ncbi:MAG: hypothetical protein PVJ76_02455 [Gemmatimonadota bacterium]|jgi:hypothetical protein